MISFIEYVKIFGLPALIWAIVVFCAYKKLPRLNIHPIFLIFAYLLLKALLIVFVYIEPVETFQSATDLNLFYNAHYFLFAVSTLILLFLLEKATQGIFKSIYAFLILLDVIFVAIRFIPLYILYIISSWPNLR